MNSGRENRLPNCAAASTRCRRVRARLSIRPDRRAEDHDDRVRGRRVDFHRHRFSCSVRTEETIKSLTEAALHQYQEQGYYAPIRAMPLCRG